MAQPAPLGDDQIVEAVTYNDNEIINKSLREALGQYADTDTIFRIAQDRARRMGGPDNTIEQAKMMTAWIDGFTTAARAFKPHNTA